MKELEENGIGRPSTYAQIITTIETREYIEKREGKLYPTEVGFVVTDLLSRHFQDIMNVEYTAAMEEELDQIEEGHRQPPQHAQPVLEEVQEGPRRGGQGPRSGRDGQAQGHRGAHRGIPTLPALSNIAELPSSTAFTNFPM